LIMWHWRVALAMWTLLNVWYHELHGIVKIIWTPADRRSGRRLSMQMAREYCSDVFPPVFTSSDCKIKQS
jgi:hypothetical protein